MKVREILRLKGGTLYTAAPQDLLAKASDTMAEFDLGSLVVMENGRMAGMLTFREILKAMQTHAGKLDGMTVGEVMVKNPVVVDPEMDVNILRSIMIEKHGRYIPVLDGELLMGVISFLDVARAVLEEQHFENKMLKNYIKNWPDQNA